MDNSSLKLHISRFKKKLMSFFELSPFPPPKPMGIFLFCMGLLCGRATLLGVLRPFGGAFFAAAFSGRYTYAYMAAALLGQLWAGAPWYEAGKYIFAMTFFALITEKLPASPKKIPSVRGGVFSLSLALSGLCFTLTSSRGIAFTTLYDVLLLLLECSVAFCATAAFCHALPIIKRMKLSYTFTSTQEISLVSLLGCALWGGKDISDIGFINLANVACILIILSFSIRLGTSKGAVAGLTMGLVSALGSGRVDISCVSYAFSGLAAGLFSVYGSIPACSGFILSNALITALANGSTEVLINIYDIFAACLIYSFIPEKVFLRLTSFGTRNEKDRIAEDERSYSGFVLMNAKRAVGELAGRIEKLHEKRIVKNETEMKFYERIARRSCTGCGMRRLCWSKDAKKTMHALKCALTAFNETGKLHSELLPANCMRPSELKEAFLQTSELYRSDVIWQGKLTELKEASYNQMKAFGEILSATEKTLSEGQSFDRALADDIARRLAQENISAYGTVVMRDEDYDPTVMLTLSPCGGFALCDKGACEIVSRACGRQMIRAGKRDCKNCRVRYVPVIGQRINFALSRRIKDRKHVSGDSALFRVINKSLYAAVLTDGMGYGEKAAFEARGAAETLLDLIEVGVSGEKAMEIVNSLLIPYGEATFSTADLCLYDASEGRAQIIKCGGAASFTKSGDRVDALYSRTMPLGSNAKSSVESFTLSAKSGDIIVMISDGVLDGGGKNALKDTWLINELEKFTGDDPNNLANLIAQRALEKCGMAPRDDITVLAAYIE